MGCGQSTGDAPEGRKQSSPPSRASSGGEAGQTPATSSTAKVVNAAGLVIACRAAAAALELVRHGVPFAGALIGAVERVHQVYHTEEDIQIRIETLATRLLFLTGDEDYESLSQREKKHLDYVLKQAATAVERGYSRRVAEVFRPEDVVADLDTAGHHLTAGVSDITLYRNRRQQVEEEIERRTESKFVLPTESLVVDRYLTQSRCKIYLGSLTLSTGKIASVAIKLCQPDGDETVEQLREQLLQGECKLQRQARHRSILTLFGVVMHHPHPRCQGCVLLVTPYLELGDLEDVMASNESAPPSVARSEAFLQAQQLLTQPPHVSVEVPKLLINISSGLRHIHGVEPPIVHLDIKPANVLVDFAGSSSDGSFRLMPKIADFDLSRELPPQRKTTTRPVSQGTHGYISPEVADPKLGKKGPWSDVFAFGMLIHFCITRTHPFSKMGDAEALLALHTKQRPALRQAGRNCPAFHEALCSLAEECWEQLPEKRPSMDRVWQRLALHVEAQQSRSSAGEGSSSSSVPQQPATIATGSANSSSACAPGTAPMPASLPALGGTAAAAMPSSLLAAGNASSSSASATMPASLPASGNAPSLAVAANTTSLLPQQQPAISAAGTSAGKAESLWEWLAGSLWSTPGSAPQQPPVPVIATGSTAAAAAAPSELLAAGTGFSLLLLQKRKELISFGQNDSGERDLPEELRVAGWTSGASRQRLRPSVEVLQVAAGEYHALYLVQEEGEDRTAVHAAGSNYYKQCEVPQALGRGPAVKAVAAGRFHSLALTVAGKVLGWGRNGDGETDVQAFEKVQLVAAGGDFSAVVTEDHKLHVVGYCHNEELKRGVQLSGKPIAMAAGGCHIVVLNSDGRAQGFRPHSTEYDNLGQERVLSSSIGERRIEAIACGWHHTVYLLQGGGVVAAGWNDEQQCDCRLRSSAVAVAAGYKHTVALLKDGTLQTFGATAVCGAAPSPSPKEGGTLWYG